MPYNQETLLRQKTGKVIITFDILNHAVNKLKDSLRFPDRLPAYGMNHGFSVRGRKAYISSHFRQPFLSYNERKEKQALP
jgi:hypothetical protein